MTSHEQTTKRRENEIKCYVNAGRMNYVKTTTSHTEKNSWLFRNHRACRVNTKKFNGKTTTPKKFILAHWNRRHFTYVLRCRYAV